MAFNRSQDRVPVSLAQHQLARVAAEGSGRHSHLNALLEGTGIHSGRDLADAIHLLCSLHGRHPGLLELTLQRSTSGSVQSWLVQAAESFERERLYLVRLTSAVGPVPSTPGAAETEASLVAQRHALETLAVSERNGCALGAATALVGDWVAIRLLLDRVSLRLGLVCPPPSLSAEASVADILDLSIESPSAQRAIAFGGEQLLLQHRALFDLLEARASARGDY